MSFALIAIGLVTLLGQVALLRELLVAFFGSELIYVLALGLWLLGSAFGALLGGRRFGAAPTTLEPVAWLLIVLGLLLPLDVVLIRGLRPLLGTLPGAYLDLPVQLIVLAATLLPPSILAGALLRRAASVLVARGGRLIRAYAIESAGGILGGILATLLLRFGLANLAGALLAGLVATATGALLPATGILSPGLAATHERYRRTARAVIGALGAVALAVGMFASTPIDRRLATWNHADLVASRDTPYGRITVTAAAGQVALFEDGALVATSEDTAAEEIVHLAVLQRARLDSVLVLGFGSGNEVGQLLAHQPAAIDWVVVDAEIVHWLAAYLPDEVGRALASPTVHLIEADPRAWLAKSARYDLILSNLAAPASGRANRFWTEEFFASAREHLRPAGVLACRLRAAENVWTPARLRRAASIHQALTAAMTDVVVLPGMHAYMFLASDRPLTRDPALLAGRLAEVTPPPRYLTGAYLDYLYTSDRFVAAKTLLAEADIPANRDVYPACYAYTLTIWLSHFLPELTWRDWRDWGGGWFGVRSVWLALLAMTVAALVARRSDLGRRCVLAAIAGLAGMILEAVLLLHYQVHRGVLYQDLGFLFTAFMAGLAVGGEALARVRTPGIRLHLAVAAGLALLGVGTAWLTVHGAATGLIATAGLLLLAGAVTAALLGIATRRGRPYEEPLAGPLLAADLVGGCLGGVAAALVLVPLLGLPGAALATVALAGIAVLVA